MRFILFAAAAALLISQTTTAQEKETIEGNGKLVTRDVTVTSFDALTANGVYELTLTQGDKESVTIEADENLQELITVSLEGSRLVVDTKKMRFKNLKTKHKMRVFITFKKLKSFEIGTVGNVTCDNNLSFDDVDVKNRSVGNVHLKMTANKLNLETTGVGNTELSGKAENAVVKSSGVGSLKAGSFLVQTLDIENTGVGHADVNAEKTLKVKDSFLGKVRNRGNASPRKMNKVEI